MSRPLNKNNPADFELERSTPTQKPKNSQKKRRSPHKKTPTQEPETLIQEPKTPPQEPKAPPAQEPKTPTQEAKAPTQEPETLIQEPKTPSQEPKAPPVQEPKAPTQEPKAPTQEPEIPIQEPKTPAQELEMPIQKPRRKQKPKAPTQEGPTQKRKTPVQEPETPTQEPKTPAQEPETATQGTKDPEQEPKMPTQESAQPPVQPPEEPSQELFWGDRPLIKIGEVDIVNGDISEVATKIANMGKESLKFIEKHINMFGHAYRIELLPQSNASTETMALWEFQLHLDPVAWFDAISTEEKDIAISKSRHYVDETRGTYRPQMRSSAFTPVRSRTYCNRHNLCLTSEYFASARNEPCTVHRMQILQPINITSINSGKKNSERRNSGRKTDHSIYIEPEIFCQGGSNPQKHRSPTPCNWYAEDERKVKTIDNDKWVILTRTEHERDLLFIPHKHAINKDLIKDVDFWTVVLKQLVSEFLLLECGADIGYPVERFAANFGKWESQTFKDDRATDCHAHLHVHLTPKAVEKLESKFEAIQGKVNDPVHYGIQNCIELETRRLTGLEVGDVKKGITKFENKLEERMVELEKKLEERMTGFEKKLEERMTTFENRLEKMLSALLNHHELGSITPET